MRMMVIGPASDGGYYLLGYNADAAFAFTDMPWSTPAVFEETLRRFAQRGIDAGLPALPGGFEGFEHIGIHAHADEIAFFGVVALVFAHRLHPYFVLWSWLFL